MIKIAGCMLIMYASFMAGHTVGQYQLRRVKELEEIIMFIQMVKSQMVYAGTEIPELLMDCEQRLTGTVRIWIHNLIQILESDSDRTLPEMWRESLKVLDDLSALPEEAVADVDRLGRVLGDLDVEAQMSRINLLENVLRNRYERERSRSTGVQRLANSLGILGGVFIVVMLV